MTCISEIKFQNKEVAWNFEAGVPRQAHALEISSQARRCIAATFEFLPNQREEVDYSLNSDILNDEYMVRAFLPGRYSINFLFNFPSPYYSFPDPGQAA